MNTKQKLQHSHWMIAGSIATLLGAGSIAFGMAANLSPASAVAGLGTPSIDGAAKSAPVPTAPAMVSPPLVVAPSGATPYPVPAAPPGAGQFVQVSQNALPSVVNIFTAKSMRNPHSRGAAPGAPGGGGDEETRRFFEQFFALHGAPFGQGGQGGQGFGQAPEAPEAPAPRANSLGSGFVIEADGNRGLILTNYHVIDGADEVQVKFTETDDEAETPAKIIGRDPDLDIALLEVKTTRKLQPIVLGDSDAMQVGDWILAVGNPFGHGHSVTHGIVSAKERALPGGFGKYLQVDAPINPGNSGGPLVNLKGEVVGVNNAIDARASGIGFAIPINSVKGILAQLKQNGRVERGHVGLAVEALPPALATKLGFNPEVHAALVAQVLPGGPGARAGIKPYDVVMEVNARPVHSPNDLVEAVRSLPIGAPAHFKVFRDGRSFNLDVEIGKRPVTES